MNVHTKSSVNKNIAQDSAPDNQNMFGLFKQAKEEGLLCEFVNLQTQERTISSTVIDQVCFKAFRSLNV